MIKANNVAAFGKAVGEFQSAFRSLASFELNNHSILSGHILVGASVDASGIVTREHLMPGTQYHHDWIEGSFEQEERPVYWKICSNCGLGFFKEGGDAATFEGWSPMPQDFWDAH